MSKCIFCKIIKKEIPSYVVLEDENFLAFLDLEQNTYGHTLVIPKKHSKNIFETTNEIKEEILFFVEKTKEKLEEKLDPVGFNIISNVEEVAGQSVFHTHVHILPRYSPQEFNFTYSKRNYDPKEIYEKIK